MYNIYVMNMADKKKILIIDDEEISREILTGILGSKYEVIAVESGQKGLDLLDSFQPNIVLLDYIMPEMNGLEVMERMDKKLSWSSIPVFILTSERDVKTELAFLRAGAWEFLRKPFEVEIMLLRIARVLEMETVLRNQAMSL